MTQGIVSQAWTITPNVRSAYTTLNAMGAWWFYQNHLAIKAKWTLKWTCDGTTGPTGVSDATDRLTDATKTATRATVAAAAQSWAVYSNVDGVQLKITYQGTSDDILKIGYSRSDGYVLAVTTTNEPTATDECFHIGPTVIGAGLSADRVMSIWVRSDGRGWRCATWRSGVGQSIIWVDKGTSLAGVRITNPIMTPPYSNGHINGAGTTRYTNIGSVMGAPPSFSTANNSILIRAYTDIGRNIPVGGGGVTISGALDGGMGTLFFNDKPAAQNNEGLPMLPIWWSGPRVLNQDGWFLSPLDFWCCYSSNDSTIPASADSFGGYNTGDDYTATARSNWLMALGPACVWPWLNIAPSMETV